MGLKSDARTKPQPLILAVGVQTFSMYTCMNDGIHLGFIMDSAFLKSMHFS